MDVHVYWTKDDNAEEYLGVVSNVAAAGRIAIPTSHTKGFIRIQIQGGGVGNTSQYSGLAQVKSLYDIDTDKDGLSDGAELDGPGLCKTGTDPKVKDSDGDGLSDGQEVKGSKLTHTVTYNERRPANKKAIGLVKTNPCVKDTDKDGLTDGQEVKGSKINQKAIRPKKLGGAYTIGTRQSNPLLKDTDKDGLTDKQEVTGSANAKYGKHRTDPTRADSDWGGAKDGAEAKRGTDPAVSGK